MLIGKEVINISHETKDLLKVLEQQGCSIVHTKKNHYKIFFKGQWVTTLAGTPSDWRSQKNSIAYLRRAGLHL
mgnify:CR=1 FL=1